MIPAVKARLSSSFLLVFAVVYSIISCSTPEPKLIPREVLFGNPQKAAPRISPDGARLAYLAPSDGVLNVWVRSVGQEDDRVVTDDRDRGIRRYFWASDNEHIMYLQDVGGNENWRLYDVSLDTGAKRDLTPYENVRVEIVKVDKHFPDHILVSMNKRDPQVFDVYELNLGTGALKLTAENPGNIVDWTADADLNVRAAQAATPDGGLNLLVRDRGDSPWRTVVQWGPDDAMSSGSLSFNRDGGSIYLLDSRDYNAGRLVSLALADASVDVIAEDPNYDVSGVELNPDTYRVEAVSFQRARNEWLVLDEAVREDFRRIEKLDRGDFAISSRDDADRKWVVGFVADDGPVSYYIYDRGSKKAAFLFVHRPELNDYRLARMEPVSFESRDGLTVHGYVTYPVGKGKKGLPMVLNVHGGPWARDVWGYDPEAQWFANRGYACFQINYRGSSGYGKGFINAGDREWGRKMHDDLIDGVNWAVQKGIADPKRVAIYGGSYGGYAALAGATFTPDVFRCAVDIVGPSNLVTLIKSVPPYWKPMLAMFHKRVGDPDTEADFLLSRSPLSKVDQIRIPILIAQGANDPRVKQAESEQIVDAMKARGIDYEYMLFPDEGHGFAKPENRLKFYAAAEKFLAKHLGGRYEE